jgi:hypothetical protein
MTMNIKLEYFPEPKLQFGHYFEHEDTKTGLAEYGPFGKNIDGLHPKEIRLGFIGTRETVAGCREWVEQCAQPIESENVKRSPAAPQFQEAELFENGGQSEAQSARYEKSLTATSSASMPSPPSSLRLWPTSGGTRPSCQLTSPTS